MRWGLPALTGIVAVGLWYLSRPAPAPPELDPEPAEAAPPAALQVPGGTRTAVDRSGVDPCSGLELLDVEAGGDGRGQGVWLRNRLTGPLLVRPGGEFSKFTLTRIATVGPGHRSAKLWFGSDPRPCELDVVAGIDLARALPAPPAEPQSTRGEQPPPPVLQPQGDEKYEREPQDQIRNPARAAQRFGRRPLGAGRSTGQASSASVDAGLR